MAHAQTTAAAAIYTSFLGFGETDHDVMIWSVLVFFNGPTPEAQFSISFNRNAGALVKQNAVRAAVNDYLTFYEPATTPLTNANIQISGQPV